MINYREAKSYIMESPHEGKPLLPALQEAAIDSIQERLNGHQGEPVLFVTRNWDLLDGERNWLPWSVDYLHTTYYLGIPESPTLITENKNDGEVNISLPTNRFSTYNSLELFPEVLEGNINSPISTKSNLGRPSLSAWQRRQKALGENPIFEVLVGEEEIEGWLSERDQKGEKEGQTRLGVARLRQSLGIAQPEASK